MFPPQIYMLKSNPQVMVFQDGTFWGVIGPEGGVVMNGISVLITEIPESSLHSLLPTEDTATRWPLTSQEAGPQPTLTLPVP